MILSIFKFIMISAFKHPIVFSNISVNSNDTMGLNFMKFFQKFYLSKTEFYLEFFWRVLKIKSLQNSLLPEMGCNDKNVKKMFSQIQIKLQNKNFCHLSDLMQKKNIF